MEGGRALDNGLEELYVNALARDGGEVSALMRVLTEVEAYDETRFPETSRVKRRLRETEEGREDMGSVIEEIRAECIAEGKAEGKLETLVRLVRDGLISVQDAATSVRGAVSAADAADVGDAAAARGPAARTGHPINWGVFGASAIIIAIVAAGAIISPSTVQSAFGAARSEEHTSELQSQIGRAHV